MLRSGLILGVAGPAALLTLLVMPLVRDGADLVQLQGRAKATLIDGAPSSTGYIQMSSVPQSRGRADNETAKLQGHVAQDKASTKPPRRLMKEGCEGAISSLAGPEARRMVPGRCIA